MMIMILNDLFCAHHEDLENLRTINPDPEKRIFRNSTGFKIMGSLFY